jgi:cytoskeletal protein RodZ
MNPWGLVVILLGGFLIVIGVKGSQHQVLSAITNKPYTGSTNNSSSNTSQSQSSSSSSSSSQGLTV